MAFSKAKQPAFSLVELVVVIVIIGILAAIAIPRLSRGSAGAGQSALAADLALTRNAINLYATEHNGAYPGPDAAGFVGQLTKYTDLSGATSATKDATHKYGPYLVAMPPCPVGENAGKTTANAVLIVATSPPVPAPATGEGWAYNVTTGEFIANTAQNDDAGKSFKDY